MPTPGIYTPRATACGHPLPLWTCCGEARAVWPSVQHLAMAHGLTGSRAWLLLDAVRQAMRHAQALKLRIEGG
jgi:hypothetical protein